MILTQPRCVFGVIILLKAEVATEKTTPWRYRVFLQDLEIPLFPQYPFDFEQIACLISTETSPNHNVTTTMLHRRLYAVFVKLLGRTSTYIEAPFCAEQFKFRLIRPEYRLPQVYCPAFVFLAQFNCLILLARLRSGFLTATKPWRPDSTRRRAIVRLDTSQEDDAVSCETICGAVRRLFLKLVSMMYLSAAAEVLLGLPDLFLDLLDYNYQSPDTFRQYSVQQTSKFSIWKLSGHMKDLLLSMHILQIVFLSGVLSSFSQEPSSHNVSTNFSDISTWFYSWEGWVCCLLVRACDTLVVRSRGRP